MRVLSGSIPSRRNESPAVPAVGDALSRTLERLGTPHVRSLDAMAAGRRGDTLRSLLSYGATVAAGHALVRARARHARVNHEYSGNGVANWCGALVGTGHRPVARTTDAAERTALASAFADWSDDADAEGRTDFAGLQLAVAEHLVTDGEGLVILADTPDGLRLRVIPPEMLDAATTRGLPDGGAIVNGVELDARGRRVAYWILPERPESTFAPAAPPVRIDAADVLHIMRPLGAGQVRGLSWLAAAVLAASDLDGLLDALRMGARVAALHAGFVTDAGQLGQAPFPDATGDIAELSLEPGTVRVLPPGHDIKFSAPSAMRDTPGFVRLNLQGLAAALQIPEHLLSGDLSQANYSSLRAGLLPFRQRVAQIQATVLAPQLLRPVWRRWLAGEVLAGRVDAPLDLRATWIAPPVPHLDPAKEIAAAREALDLGLTSRTALVTEAGRLPEELDAERAADAARAAELGLTETETAE